jgi:dienelactone hydrolase
MMRVSRTTIVVTTALAGMLAGCAPTAPPVTLVPLPEVRQQQVWIPEPGSERGLFTQICRPASLVPARVVVINHGSPGPNTERSAMRPESCDSEAVQWFLARGFMAVLPMRRGFGATGGPMAESSGPCEMPDYVAAGQAGATDIAAAVDYATALPDARPDDAVVIGQSLGGWGVIAYGSLPHPRVSALISMAGGRGGWAGGQPGVNCRPDLLARAAGIFAQGAHTPMLWIYARNDSFFPPDVVGAMARAYVSAGGTLDLVQPDAFGRDGHFLFFGTGGSRIWGPAVEHYLTDRPGS